VSDEDHEIPGVPMPPRPERAAKFVGRALLMALIGLLGWSIWSVSRKAIGDSTNRLMQDAPVPVDPSAARAEHAHAVAAKRAEVAAVDSQIDATKEALERLEKREKPTFSFGDGERKEFDRLNEETRKLELKRAELAAQLAAMEAQ
jgi:hypothetical protein